MADPTPLILADCNQKPQNQSLSPNSSLDEIIEKYIGEFSWAQFIQVVLVSFAWVFDAQQTFISVFTDAMPPNWSCTSPTSKVDNYFSPHTSIITEWGLQCSDSLITGLPTSSFFLGCFIGGLILATLADSSSLGRKNMLLLSTLLMSLAGVFTAVFSANIWVYSVLRFISGFGRATIGTNALVLSSELVGKRWRGEVGSTGFLCFFMGFLLLPLIAYLCRVCSWRVLYLWTCGPAIFYCVLLHFFGKESPRWLFVQGRKQEFFNTVKSIASCRCSFTGDENVLFINNTEEANVGFYYSLKILVEKKWMVKRLLAVMVVGFGTGMVYYGMPLGLGNLAFGNIYVSATLNALSELPASLFVFFLIGRSNRKGLVLALATLSGVFSILCVVVQDERLQIGAELVSFLTACSASDVLLIFTLELFPTCTRNSAISMARQAMVLGGAFSPMLVASGRKNGFFSFMVFGLSVGLSGLFIMLVPETRGRTLSDTTDEEEYNIKQ